jgi:hypothetical protein
VLRFGAIIGAATVSMLAIAPVFAAAPVSQSTAQSLNLAIAGNNAISQKVTISNDGTTQTKSSNDTLPTIASVIPGNALLGAGVAPQDGGANADGTSYACAGIAGTGGGIVKVGNTGCNINGKPLTISLADLSLGNALLGQDSALGSALNNVPGIGTLLSTLGTTLNGLTTQISNALAATPLGDIKVGGSLSAIEATCQANPDAATGTAHLVDSSGGSNATPIGITIPNGTGGTQTITLLNLPANPPPNTNLLINLGTVTGALTTALQTELNTALTGALASVSPLLATLQSSLLQPLSNALTPLTTQLSNNILDVTLNKQSSADAGRSIDVTALDLQVLPAAASFTGSSLIGGQLGRVTCGPNTRVAAPTPTTTPTGGTPKPPTVVDSGLMGDSTTQTVLGATAALMLLAGTVGLIGYRRSLVK